MTYGFGTLLTNLMRESRPDGRLGRFLLVEDVQETWHWSMANRDALREIPTAQKEQIDRVK